MPPNPAEGFTLFVSCVEGQPVTRFGTGVFIGAHRDPAQPNSVVYDPTMIVAITAAEHARHRKPYDRLIADGALRVRTADEWIQQGKRIEREAETSQRKRVAAEAAAAPAKAASTAEE